MKWNQWMAVATMTTTLTTLQSARMACVRARFAKCAVFVCMAKVFVSVARDIQLSAEWQLIRFSWCLRRRCCQRRRQAHQLNCNEFILNFTSSILRISSSLRCSSLTCLYLSLSPSFSPFCWSSMAYSLSFFRMHALLLFFLPSTTLFVFARLSVCSHCCRYRLQQFDFILKRIFASCRCRHHQTFAPPPQRH